MVTVNVTLQNNASTPNMLYVYATNSSTPQVIFNKVYSQSPVPANGTITLSGAFKMPNSTLTLMIRSGHTEDNNDVDDGRFAFSIIKSQSPPPIQRASFSVLAMEWAPWIGIIVVLLGSVPLVGMYARKRRKPIVARD